MTYSLPRPSYLLPSNIHGPSSSLTPTNNREMVHTAFPLAYEHGKKNVFLYHTDCLPFMDHLIEKHPQGRFDMIFADPPYFLSNGGFTCHAGEKVSVNKGKWDQSRGAELDHEFNLEWLSRCQKTLNPNGTLWVSGTMHVIHSIGYAMQKLGFKILNDITWEKPNPPPNLSCRYFTHATETVLWAAKNKQSKHCFNYDLIREENGGKQMKSVWEIAPPATAEKKYGKHPTQKPVALLDRCIRAATKPGNFVFDPFAGSATTGVAAVRLGRKFCGVEKENDFAEVAASRLRDEVLALTGQ